VLDGLVVIGLARQRECVFIINPAFDDLCQVPAAAPIKDKQTL
jgi:hypothetical protein